MKKLFLTVILIITMVLLTACNSDIVVSSDDLLITTLSYNSRPIQQTEYNRKTNITTAYIYMYEQCPHCHGSFLTDFSVVSKDSNGNIISSIEDG